VAILNDLLIVFGQMVLMLLQVYIFIVVARAVISWVGPDPHNPIVRFLYTATDPVLQRIRRVLPLQFSGFDLSPMALLFALFFVQRLIQRLLMHLG
jgi:YggT family protein